MSACCSQNLYAKARTVLVKSVARIAVRSNQQHYHNIYKLLESPPACGCCDVSRGGVMYSKGMKNIAVPKRKRFTAHRNQCCRLDCITFTLSTVLGARTLSAVDLGGIRRWPATVASQSSASPGRASVDMSAVTWGGHSCRGSWLYRVMAPGKGIQRESSA